MGFYPFLERVENIFKAHLVANTVLTWALQVEGWRVVGLVSALHYSTHFHLTSTLTSALPCNEETET